MPSLIEANRQLQIVAIVSSLGCLIVVLTSLFPCMRGNIFMRIISFIAFATICGDIPYFVIMRTDDGSLWCTIQGFLNLYFYPVSWVWTTVLMCFLFRMATGQKPFSEIYMHFVGWGAPCVTTLLVLSTNTYGRFSSNDDNDVCTIGGPYETAFIWHIFSYYGLFIICLVVMVVLYFRILKIQESGLVAVSSHMMKLVLDSLMLYPLFMIICWTPELVAFIIQFINDNDEFYHCALIIKLSNGFFTTCVFFGKSQQARKLWLQILTGNSHLGSRAVLFSADSASPSEASDIFATEFLENSSDFATKSLQKPLLPEGTS